MKLKTTFLLIFWAFLYPVAGQSIEDLKLEWQDFAQTSECVNLDKTTERFLNRLFKHENQLLEKTEIARAQWLFNQTKTNFFFTYNEQADFNGMLKSGVFNCLTGTSLLASLFDQFGISHQVIETNHHIFILIDSPEKVLLEVTDPNGFITNEKEIEFRINRYQQQTQMAVSGHDNNLVYRYTFNLWQTVSLADLKGRLLYNEAVKSYNKRDLALAINQLAQAGACSFSERYVEFAQVLSLSVKLNENLDTEKKNQLLLQLKNISRKNAAYALSVN